nr:hypothetical protein [uncultured Pedobacter sp.]
MAVIKTLDMNSEPKKKNEKPSSNFREEVSKDKVPAGNKAVKKPEDKDYNKEEANFKNPARKREESEQPIHSIKKAPKE